MLMIYVAIALFILIILWLALQPKQGTKASNAPDDDAITYQLPKPEEPMRAEARPKASPLPKVEYELSEPEAESVSLEPMDESDREHPSFADSKMRTRR